MPNDPAFESYVTSVVRPLLRTTREERLKTLRDAKFNLFKIPAKMVMFDLLTDSGTGAISNQQLAEIFGRLLKNSDSLRGLEITWEPPILRHFTCEFRQT